MSARTSASTRTTSLTRWARNQRRAAGPFYSSRSRHSLPAASGHDPSSTCRRTASFRLMFRSIRLRVGAWSTRTTHPFYMARWQEMLDGLGIAATLVESIPLQDQGRDARRVPQRRTSCARHVSRHDILFVNHQGALARPRAGTLRLLRALPDRRAAIDQRRSEATRRPTLSRIYAVRPLNSKSRRGRARPIVPDDGAPAEAQRPGLARILVHKSGPLSDYTSADSRRIRRRVQARHRGSRHRDGPCRGASRMTVQRSTDLTFTATSTCFPDPVGTDRGLRAQAYRHTRRDDDAKGVDAEQAVDSEGSRYVHAAIGLHPELAAQRHTEITLFERADGRHALRRRDRPRRQPTAPEALAVAEAGVYPHSKSAQDLGGAC